VCSCALCLGAWQAYEKLRRIAADRFSCSLSPSLPLSCSAVQESSCAKMRKPSLNWSLTLRPFMCVHTNTNAAQRSRHASGGLLFCCHPPSLQQFPCALDQDLKQLKQLHQELTRVAGWAMRMHMWHSHNTATLEPASGSGAAWLVLSAGHQDEHDSVRPPSSATAAFLDLDAFAHTNGNSC
jgi:hypothetical protein